MVVSSPANALHFVARAGFLRRPRELAAELGQRRLVVGLVDVRQRHRLAAVALADRLIVRQVDADRRDRPRVAGFDDDVDGVGGDAVDALLAVLRIPRHAILEPLRVLGDLLDLRRLLAVDVEDQRFPRALDAARVEVDLDEAVDRVDRRRLVLHPGDVVRLAVRVVAGLVERDRARAAPRAIGSVANGIAASRCRDDRGDLRCRSGRRRGRPLRRSRPSCLTSREFSG